MFSIIYFALCLIVGVLGISRWGGFLLHFFLAVFITPPGALLLMILLMRRKKAPRIEVFEK